MKRYKITMNMELKKFLLKKRIYNKFITNTRASRRDNYHDFKVSTFSTGFDWSESPEGFDFWNRYYEKLQKYEATI